MIRRWPSLILPCALALAVQACGYGLFQTARTVPRGEYRFMVAGAFQGNELIEERGVTPFNFAPQVDMRIGVADRVDLGVGLLLGPGLLVDAKANVMPPGHDLAVSISAGLGGAWDMGQVSAWLLHVPVNVIASYTFGGKLTPYAAVGYGFFWIFGRQLSNPDPNAAYVARGGWGDGVMRLTAGLEWRIRGRFAVLVEYSYLPAVVDDPGDNFAFVDNHVAGFGARF
ncbi:MAG: outer membrane beta-barrel protein [Deltaproteobacteria bacterium]|nr:outer membrane beta-barrel protein [Deltaproteobacteria bacterium]